VSSSEVLSPAVSSPELAMLRAVEGFSRTLREAGAALVRDAECSRATATLVRMLAVRTRSGLPTQVGDVAHALRVDMSVASRQVSQLVDDGLVERTVDSDDRRARTLRLTAAGLERADAIDKALITATADLLSDWTPQDVAAAIELIVRLTATFDRATVPAHERAPA